MILILYVFIFGISAQGPPDDPPSLGCDVSLTLEEKIEKFRSLEIDFIGENYEETQLELNEGNITGKLIKNVPGRNYPEFESYKAVPYAKPGIHEPFDIWAPCFWIPL